MINAGLTNDEYVERLYIAMMGRASDAEGKAHWISRLESGLPRESIFASFANSSEFGRICRDHRIIQGRVLDPSRPVIALTFDDGPSIYTEALLDVLEKHNVPATFYVNGKNIAGNENTIRRAFNLRCEIGNHAWTHAWLTSLSFYDVRYEIVHTSNAIRAITGVLPATMRPPYGSYDSNVVLLARENRMPIINWTLNGELAGTQYTYNAREVANNVINNSRSGDIVLLHDTYGDIVAATERIITELARRGFQFATVSELLHFQGIKLNPGQVYGQTHR
jgi:peptidoglycan/xylan/chitin deacetylase (PgdA/CDA1 family)